MKTYRLFIELNEPEFLALARLGNRELRAPKYQAVQILRETLIQVGELNADSKPSLISKTQC